MLLWLKLSKLGLFSSFFALDENLASWKKQEDLLSSSIVQKF